MKSNSIESRVQDDMKIMEEYLYRDGEVPPVIFFHFKKINPKIANMMNKVDAGKLPVKQGFFFAINDQGLAEKRYDFMHYMGTILAAMELLHVLEAPESVVFCAEGWASKIPKKNLKSKNFANLPHPSKDPQAIDVFMGAGLDRDGGISLDMKEKHIKMVKTIKGESTLRTELVQMKTEANESSEASSHVPILQAFFSSYHDSLEKMKKDKSYMRYDTMAKEDPVDAFRQGMDAAVTMTRLLALQMPR